LSQVEHISLLKSHKFLNENLQSGLGLIFTLLPSEKEGPPDEVENAIGEAKWD
jgi:hypothetical protein